MRVKSSLKFIKLWLPVVIWAGFIFYLSSVPNLKTNLKYDFILRKTAHIAEYFILTLLLRIAIKGLFKIDNCTYNNSPNPPHYS
jgi:VanZ family protein